MLHLEISLWLIDKIWSICALSSPFLSPNPIFLLLHLFHVLRGWLLWTASNGRAHFNRSRLWKMLAGHQVSRQEWGLVICLLLPSHWPSHINGCFCWPSLHSLLLLFNPSSDSCFLLLILQAYGKWWLQSLLNQVLHLPNLFPLRIPSILSMTLLNVFWFLSGC